MIMTKSDADLAKSLIAGRSPREVQAMLHTANNQMLHDADLENDHALTGFSLSDKEFDAFCQFLMDGGSVDDDSADLGDGRGLMEIIWQALHDRDQATFWQLLPLVFKHHAKSRGFVEKLPGGGVRMNGGPTMVPLASQANIVIPAVDGLKDSK